MLIDAQEISIKHDGWPLMIDHPKLAAGLRRLADALESQTVYLESITTWAKANDDYTVQTLIIKYVEKEQGNEQQG